jgi:hypothetical protein
MLKLKTHSGFHDLFLKSTRHEMMEMRSAIINGLSANVILASMIYFDSDMSKSTNTVVYFDWKMVIYIYACGKCRTQFMLPMEKSVTFTNKGSSLSDIGNLSPFWLSNLSKVSLPDEGYSSIPETCCA